MAKINVDLIYPVGSIYININNTNPSIFFGGTWEQIQARYLMGAGKPSKNSYDGFGQITDDQVAYMDFAPATLGELTHQLIVNELPPHSHSTYAGAETGGFPYRIAQANGYAGGNSYCSTMETGAGWAHNNLPPTLVVYIWKRIA